MCMFRLHLYILVVLLLWLGSCTARHPSPVCTRSGYACSCEQQQGGDGYRGYLDEPPEIKRALRAASYKREVGTIPGAGVPAQLMVRLLGSPLQLTRLEVLGFRVLG